MITSKETKTAASALEQVADLYQKYDLDPDFATELVDHLRTGIVVSRPCCFAMGKAVMLDDGRPAWFIAAVLGNLRELLILFPWQMPYIAFRRRGEDRIRVYPTNQLLRKLNALC